MSDRTQKPRIERTVDPTVRETPSPVELESAGGPLLPAAAARLQAIHDLVHSGDYHVPASVIADRIIEKMMTEKRGTER